MDYWTWLLFLGTWRYIGDNTFWMLEQARVSIDSICVMQLYIQTLYLWRNSSALVNLKLPKKSVHISNLILDIQIHRREQQWIVFSLLISTHEILSISESAVMKFNYFDSFIHTTTLIYKYRLPCVWVQRWHQTR